MKNCYNKPYLVIENFVPNVSVSSCTCTVTFFGDVMTNVYYDSDKDGYYDNGERYTNIGTSRTVTIDIQQNKELGYIFKASTDNAGQGIKAGDLRMRGLTNSTYNFYTTYYNNSKKYTNTSDCGVLGIDGKMYMTNRWGFSSITNKTAS